MTKKHAIKKKKYEIKKPVFYLQSDLQAFAEDPPPGEPPAQPAVSLDLIQSFVSESEEGKRWLQSLTDSRVTDAIKTYETNTLPKRLDEEISKRFPAETEDQKKLRELQQQIESITNEKTRESNKNKALSIATEKGLPTSLVDYFIGADEETTIKNLGALEESFTAAVKAGVDAEVQRRFGEGGRNPNPSNLNGGGAGESIGKQVAAGRIPTANLEETRNTYFK